jgi:TRAP-type C4-dicarboxylate transport system permease small subunit
MTPTPEEANTILQTVAQTDTLGFAHILIFTCFAYMIWQSWLQYRTKSRNDVEIDAVKARMDKFDKHIEKLFGEFERMSVTLARIDGRLADHLYKPQERP